MYKRQVYTKEAETADMYIEQASYDLSRKHRVRVATSDGMEQMIILGHGAERLSATELKLSLIHIFCIRRAFGLP